MSTGVNKVILIGRLGKDPEVRNLNNNQKVANFSICCQENYKDKSGQRKEVTEWVNLVCWNGLADVASKYLHKGNPVFVEGKLRTRSFEANGQTRYVTEVHVEHLVLIGQSEKRDTQQSQEADENFWNR